LATSGYSTRMPANPVLSSTRAAQAIERDHSSSIHQPAIAATLVAVIVMNQYAEKCCNAMNNLPVGLRIRSFAQSEPVVPILVKENH
jgi:hypothetical protein